MVLLYFKRCSSGPFVVLIRGCYVLCIIADDQVFVSVLTVIPPKALPFSQPAEIIKSRVGAWFARKTYINTSTEFSSQSD